ncbi:tol-pal system protein YbgF [bacterium BMS3Abin10]|nr:tol-pal system protein YbgF [bacterium BMS3Abin10]GBE38295.1 tol-pal system protein YbgF [bacterium BMS3Bbin08]
MLSQDKKICGSPFANSREGTVFFYPTSQNPTGLPVGFHIKKVGLCFLPLVMLFMLVLAGCASTEETGRMRYELNELRSRVGNLETGGQGGGSLKDLEEGQKATAGSVSDLLIQVQSLTADVQMLTGRVDEALYASEKNSKDLAKDRDRLIARLDELETAVKALKDRSAVPGAGQAPETEETLPVKKAKDDYMEAFNTFRDNKFAEARGKFLALLQDYPENEYSDNARFWIGETYYKEQNYEDAILAYEDLMKTNPDSDKVPGAMLKQGMAFFEINDKETGRIVLERLVEKFPDSDPAKRARKKLNPVPHKKK